MNWKFYYSVSSSSNLENTKKLHKLANFLRVCLPCSPNWPSVQLGLVTCTCVLKFPLQCDFSNRATWKRVLNKNKNPTKCEILGTLKETLPFVDWVIFNPKFCTLFNHFGLIIQVNIWKIIYLNCRKDMKTWLIIAIIHTT